MFTFNLEDLCFVEQFAVKTEDFFILVELLLWYHAVARHKGTVSKLSVVDFNWARAWGGVKAWNGLLDEGLSNEYWLMTSLKT